MQGRTVSSHHVCFKDQVTLLKEALTQENQRVWGTPDPLVAKKADVCEGKKSYERIFQTRISGNKGRHLTLDERDGNWS